MSRASLVNLLWDQRQPQPKRLSLLLLRPHRQPNIQQRHKLAVFAALIPKENNDRQTLRGSVTHSDALRHRPIPTVIRP